MEVTDQMEAWIGMNQLWSTVFGLVLIACLVEFWMRSRREFRLSKTIPGPQRLPLLGNAFSFLRLSNPVLFGRGVEFLQMFGDVTRFWVGTLFVVFLTDPADVEVILSDNTHLEKTEEYRHFKPWFGNGLLISNGHHWQHHRKMIAPTFHQSILKSFIPSFVQHSKKVVESMSKKMGKEFDVHEYMSQTTVDILLSTAMGVKQMPDSSKSLEYANAVMGVCEIMHKRQWTLLHRWDSLFKFTSMNSRNSKLLELIMGMTGKVVKDRMENFNADARSIIEEDKEEVQQKKKVQKVGLRDDLDDIDDNDVGAKKRLALLDAMMAMSKNPDIKWTDKDVIDEVNTIMFEGHDTTAAGSSFVLCMLGIHKDIQKKVMAEQKAIFGDNFLRDCTFNDTMEMKYLERVIMETLRLYPPVPLITRRTGQDAKLASGPYVIPKGSTVVIFQYAIHRNPKYFPNPDKFNPDNFLPEKMANRHYYSFVPFSAGPRSCVGRKYAMLKLKVLLSTIVRNYVVDCRHKEEDLKVQADIILKIKDGFNIVLQPRQQTAEVA